MTVEVHLRNLPEDQKILKPTAKQRWQESFVKLKHVKAAETQPLDDIFKIPSDLSSSPQCQTERELPLPAPPPSRARKKRTLRPRDVVGELINGAADVLDKIAQEQDEADSEETDYESPPESPLTKACKAFEARAPIVRVSTVESTTLRTLSRDEISSKVRAARSYFEEVEESNRRTSSKDSVDKNSRIMRRLSSLRDASSLVIGKANDCGCSPEPRENKSPSPPALEKASGISSELMSNIVRRFQDPAAASRRPLMATVKRSATIE